MPSGGPGTSVTPTQRNVTKHGRSMSIQSVGEGSGHRDILQTPSIQRREGRSMSNANVNVPWGPRGASLAQTGAPPGSFSSDLRTVTLPRVGTPKAEIGGFFGADYGQGNGNTTSEQKQTELREKINKETKIKIGSENLLEALISKNAKQTKDQRQRVETELSTSNFKIAELKSQLDAEVERAYRPDTPPRSRLSGIFQGSPVKSPSKGASASQEAANDVHAESESPTYILAELLQALELEGMQADYYVERANNLVDLFKRYPSLKYDLAWPIFRLRVQTMLLSDSRDVVAAGYRVTRHAIADRGSLQTIRSLNTDNLVILSLIKDNKASIEREQALKFVRAFLDVKNGVHELSKAVLRTIISIAEFHEDRLRNMALLTVSEVFIRHPTVAMSAGGASPLAAAMVEGTYTGSETLAIAFLHLSDKPSGRILLKSGRELQAALTPFTDPLVVHGSEEKLKSSARLIASILKTWAGVFAFADGNFSALRSLVISLHYPLPFVRDLILDLLFEVLRIKPPSWASSFLAGRRLTTYGRVAYQKPDPPVHISNVEDEEGSQGASLVDHFTTLLTAMFVHCGLTEVLSIVIEDLSDAMLKRKATLLLTEVLKLANYSLTSALSAGLQIMPRPLNTVIAPETGDDILLTGMIYQVDSVNRTLDQQSGLDTKSHSAPNNRHQEGSSVLRSNESTKSKMNVDMDELQFRSTILDTQVLSSSNYLKWKWDLINDIIEGPLLNPKRLDDAIKATKFLKRLVAFYRPFKHRFSDARNTKPNQRYVRTGCALIKTLLQNPEGIIYLTESKLLRQLAECIAQLDPSSGLVSETPMLSAYRVAETLSGGYFALLGVLSGDPRGLHMIERWRMINMFYHIMDLEDHDDLTQALLGNMDFSLDSHLRVMLSKALTACPKAIRIYATKLLRKYVTITSQDSPIIASKPVRCEWAIRLLVTQLYDPEVQVCEMAVQILEEACNRKAYLEYVVRCRPALDHLGEIGAPLLLRFLSTSLGYQYLDGLDYIGQEMDGWFHGRNTTYVTLVEASLARALTVQPERPLSTIEPMQQYDHGIAPPHFYRELTRTAEGCSLLRESGHFDVFVTTIQDHWSEDEDAEIMLRTKGCLWAVGNIGSMELGAPFLEQTNVVEWIIKVATDSEVMTMRGTAFFVLGLISRSLHGMEIIAEHGWNAATDQVGRSLGLCLPPRLSAIFSMRSRNPRRFPRARRRLQQKPKLATNEDPIHNRILELTVDLGNTVLTKRAAGDLYGLKNKSPEHFNSVRLLREVMAILEAHSFGLRVRRFVLDLFDRGMMRNFILDDDNDDISGNDEDNT